MTTPPPFEPQPCCDGAAGAACSQPMQFCFSSTSTGPVEHPGRTYDLTLPINQGFAVESMNVGPVNSPANIVWEVDDQDGEQFRETLTTFMEGRLPAAAVVTITNPNAGQGQPCGAALPMQIHIECLRLDQSPPDLVELVYNGGQDMIQNPAYNESPPLNPPVAEGNYGFHLLSRQDDPGPFPGFPPSNDALCTDTANRGWETNDSGRTFEIWGKDVAVGVTPTPRGTPVQEITSDGPPPGGRSTIWQTFQAPASGDFKIRLVHGARDAGEEHIIALKTGDTDDDQSGGLIHDVTNPPAVYGGNPWTQFNQTVPLTGGQTYTLSLSSTNPAGGARGGLFTDMRAYIDRPGQRATAATDDETCVVTTEETTNTTTCEYWQPQCSDGAITEWQKLDTGETLTNTEFWAQVPAPSCCLSQASGEGEASATLSNMAVSDVVCVTVGGVQQNAVRQVVLDPSGGQLSQTFFAMDGAPVEPVSWVPGSCTDSRTLADQVLCDRTPDGRIVGSFLRKYVQVWAPDTGARIVEVRDFVLAGTAPYTLQGSATECANTATPADRDTNTTVLCDNNAGVITQFQLRQTFDGFGVLTDVSTFALDDSPYTPTGSISQCDDADSMSLGLCLPDGTPIGVVLRRSVAGTVTEDGWVNLRTGAFTVGLPPAGVIACGAPSSVQVSGTFCDVSGSTVNALVLIEYHYNPDGTIASVRLVNATTGDTYVPVGTITTCPDTVQQPDRDFDLLCDVSAGGVSTPFIRDYQRDSSGTITGFSNYTLAGAAYTPTGTVGVCTGRDAESVILCDSAAVPNRFLRTYTYGASGTVTGFADTTLAGAAFVPTGAVGICTQPTATDTDFVEEVLCDANGTSFIRLFRFNSATGVLISTTNTTLAGAAFTPVGAVGTCSNCCPQVIGEGCTNTGSGRYTAVRATNGTVTLIDSVSGAAVTQANIIACVDDDTVRTLSAQARLVGDADAAWTPGADVAGTLTSVTMTVLSGTATLTDADGTVLAGLPTGLTLTWEAEDDNQLTGPQSIDAVGGNTVVNWTQRP